VRVPVRGATEAAPQPPGWQQALKLDDNESIASIVLKLEQLSAREIAIVAPRSLKVFRNPVSMRLLQRKADDLGIAVTIISEDSFTRQLCSETGFSHYTNVETFRRDDIRRKFRDRPQARARPPISSRVSAIGALCLLVLIVIVGYVAATKPATGPGGTMLFQSVPDEKTVKNRLHLDVRPSGSMASEVARLEQIGASAITRIDEGGSFWTVMGDPEGNEFCVLRGPEDGWSGEL